MCTLCWSPETIVENRLQRYNKYCIYANVFHKKQHFLYFFVKIFGHIKKKQYLCTRFRWGGNTVAIAQLAEHRIVVPSVVGSSPTSHPKRTKYQEVSRSFLYSLLMLLLRLRIFLSFFLRFYLCFDLLPCLFCVRSEGSIYHGFFFQFGLKKLKLFVQIMYA